MQNIAYKALTKEGNYFRMCMYIYFLDNLCITVQFFFFFFKPFNRKYELSKRSEEIKKKEEISFDLSIFITNIHNYTYVETLKPVQDRDSIKIYVLYYTCI